MESFSGIFPTLPLAELASTSGGSSAHDVERILRKGRTCSLSDFATLLSPVADDYLEQMASLSARITERHFGRVIRLFAPLYLSNECINVCRYCGFSRTNPIPRFTVPILQVEKETRLLAAQGFRSLLLVAGEHPKFVNNGYVQSVIERILPTAPSIAIEIAPMETEDYLPIVGAGCEGLVVYQETYHEETYCEMHPSGPKKRFGWRLDTPERGYTAGFRRLGIGALYGLYDWRYEAVATAAHALHLLRHCWKAHLNLSFPRLRPAAGGFAPDERFTISDRELVQLICAFRILLPHAGLVLSTRESRQFRDGVVGLGITQMSAGSSTEPGGYSNFDENQWTPPADQPGEQFHIADERPPAEFARMIRRRGYEPVWKDFDRSLVSATTLPA